MKIPYSIAVVIVASSSLSKKAHGQNQQPQKLRGLTNLFDDNIHKTSERLATTTHPSYDAAANEKYDDQSRESSQQGSGPICKSIIAIGSTRLPPSSVPNGRRRQRQHTLEAEERELDDAAQPYEDHVLDRFFGSGESSSVGDGTFSDGGIFRVEDDFPIENFGIEEEGEEFVCELYSGDTIPIHSTSNQLFELRRALNDGLLISAVSTIDVAEEETVPQIDGKQDDVGMVVGMKPSEETGILESVSLPPGSIKLQTGPHRRLQHHHRSLASYNGTKQVLIVRVNDINNQSVSENATVISDKFFGTLGDVESMQSQFASCSYGDFNLTYNQYGEQTAKIVDKLSAPGVLEVDIPISLDNSQSKVRSSIQTAVQAKLGFTLPGPFTHVLFVIADCYQSCGWAAYAYINHWLSVYQNKYYAYPAVSMHEIGHNINLAHSGGIDGKAYSDHTCLMGNPLFSDDIGDMCFNPAKNYQIAMSSSGGWYDKGRVEIWDAKFSDGADSWSGKLVGIAEYDPLLNNATHVDSKVVLKLESGSATDLYVGFNRAIGINSDNRAASDMVTVTEAGGNGQSYSQSWLKAKMGEGGKYSVPYWKNGMELVVTVDEIQIDAVPGYAVVTVELVAPPSASPTTNTPTKSPTPKPTNTPTAPKDISISKYTTSNRRDALGTSKGLMFTIEARQDITIKGLSVRARRNTLTNVLVYTFDGNYMDQPLQKRDWTELPYDTPPKQQGKIVTLGDFNDEVKIIAGQTKSFYVYSRKGLLYTVSDDEGEAFGDNNSMIIHAGRVTYGLFRREGGGGKWAGTLRYHT